MNLGVGLRLLISFGYSAFVFLVSMTNSSEPDCDYSFHPCYLRRGPDKMMLMTEMTEIAQILIQSTATSFSLLSKSLPPIVLGLVLAELIVVLNAAEKIAFIARPITRFSHLSDAAGASFMMAFFSAASANSMLAG
jgi:hypothetical protein